MDVFAIDFLILQETVKTRPISVTASDSLNLSETIRNSPRTVSAQDVLVISESFGKNSISNVSVSDTLTFDEGLKTRIFDFSAEDFLFFVEIPVADTEVKSVSDVLDFSEVASVQKLSGVRDNLTFCETATLTKTISLFATDTLALKHKGGIFRPKKKFAGCFDTLTTDPIKLKFGTIEKLYRHYVFGNVESIAYTRINRNTPGGDLILSDVNENIIYTLTFTLLSLKSEELTDLRRFLSDTVGLEIELHDHEGFVWDGVITTPNSVETQTGRHTYTIDLEFQGEKR